MLLCEQKAFAVGGTPITTAVAPPEAPAIIYVTAFIAHGRRLASNEHLITCREIQFMRRGIV